LLVLRKGMVLTKEAFLNHLYGGMDEPEVKIIDVFICKLRKKLAQAGADNVIGTVWAGATCCATLPPGTWRPRRRRPRRRRCWRGRPRRAACPGDAPVPRAQPLTAPGEGVA
jgi:hypothetical protein